ncbi:MAG: GDP-L-fucose synthase, partial [Burkholderiaceae bacterium]
KGTIAFDTSKADGTPRKWLDTQRLTRLGWEPSVSLEEGLAETYQSFQRSQVENDKRIQGRALDPVSRVRRQRYMHMNAAAN